jgi:hypothetical protein
MTNLQTITDQLKEAELLKRAHRPRPRKLRIVPHLISTLRVWSSQVFFERTRERSPLAVPSTVKKDVFLNALLEVPVAKPPRRNPLEWAGAMSVHLVNLGALIIVPLYTRGTIHLPDYATVLLIAPAPPLLPAPPAAATAPRIATRPKSELTYKLHRLTAPTAIPKKFFLRYQTEVICEACWRAHLCCAFQSREKL